MNTTKLKHDDNQMSSKYSLFKPLIVMTVFLMAMASILFAPQTAQAITLREVGDSSYAPLGFNWSTDFTGTALEAGSAMTIVPSGGFTPLPSSGGFDPTGRGNGYKAAIRSTTPRTANFTMRFTGGNYNGTPIDMVVKITDWVIGAEYRMNAMTGVYINPDYSSMTAFKKVLPQPRKKFIAFFSYGLVSYDVDMYYVRANTNTRVQVKGHMTANDLDCMQAYTPKTGVSIANYLHCSQVLSRIYNPDTWDDKKFIEIIRGGTAALGTHWSIDDNESSLHYKRSLLGIYFDTGPGGTTNLSHTYETPLDHIAWDYEYPARNNKGNPMSLFAMTPEYIANPPRETGYDNMFSKKCLTNGPLTTGEQADWQLSANLPAAGVDITLTDKLTNIVFTDTLPANLSFVPGSLTVTLNGAPVSASNYTLNVVGKNITITFNSAYVRTIPLTGQTLVVKFKTKVDSVPSSGNSVEVNKGKLTLSTTSGTFSGEDDDKIEIVAPSKTINGGTSRVLNVVIGDTVVYAISQLTHASSSGLPAYSSFVFEDPLPKYVKYVSGRVLQGSTVVPSSNYTINYTPGTNIVTCTLNPSYLASGMVYGAVYTFEMTCEVIATPPDLAIVKNQGQVKINSTAPKTNIVEYEPIEPIEPSKTINGGTARVTGVKIGDEITYAIKVAIRNGGSPYSSFQFIDPLPVEVTYVSGYMTDLSTSTVLGPSDGTITYNSMTNTVTYDFSSSYLASMTMDGREYEFTMKVKVVSQPNNPDAIIENQGTVKADKGSGDTNIVEYEPLTPELDIDKQAKWTDATNPAMLDYQYRNHDVSAPNSIVKYEVVVKNTISGTIANNVVVTDVLPTGLTLIPGSIVATGAAGITTNDSGNTVTVKIPALAAGSPVTITYQCYTTTAGNGKEIVNVAKATADNVKPGRPGSSSNPASDDSEIYINEAKIDIEKVVAESSIDYPDYQDTPQHQREEFKVGDKITYTVKVKNVNPGTIAHNVNILDDEMPDGFVLDGTVNVKIDDSAFTYPISNNDDGTHNETTTKTITWKLNPTSNPSAKKWGWSLDIDYLPYGREVIITWTVTATSATNGWEVYNKATATADNTTKDPSAPRGDVVSEEPIVWINDPEFDIEKSVNEVDEPRVAGDIVHYKVELLPLLIPGTVARNTTLEDTFTSPGTDINEGSFFMSDNPAARYTAMDSFTSAVDFNRSVGDRHWLVKMKQAFNDGGGYWVNDRNYSIWKDGVLVPQSQKNPLGIDENDYCKVEYEATLNEDAWDTEIVDNKATAKSDNTPDASDDASVNLRGGELKIVKSADDGGQFYAGDVVNYQLEITNIIKGTLAKDVQISDSFVGNDAKSVEILDGTVGLFDKDGNPITGWTITWNDDFEGRHIGFDIDSNYDLRWDGVIYVRYQVKHLTFNSMRDVKNHAETSSENAPGDDDDYITTPKRSNGGVIIEDSDSLGGSYRNGSSFYSITYSNNSPVNKAMNVVIEDEFDETDPESVDIDPNSIQIVRQPMPNYNPSEENEDMNKPAEEGEGDFTDDNGVETEDPSGEDNDIEGFTTMGIDVLDDDTTEDGTEDEQDPSDGDGDETDNSDEGEDGENPDDDNLPDTEDEILKGWDIEYKYDDNKHIVGFIVDTHADLEAGDQFVLTYSLTFLDYNSGNNIVDHSAAWADNANRVESSWSVTPNLLSETDLVLTKSATNTVGYYKNDTHTYTLTVENTHEHINAVDLIFEDQFTSTEPNAANIEEGSIVLRTADGEEIDGWTNEWIDDVDGNHIGFNLKSNYTLPAQSQMTVEYQVKHLSYNSDTPLNNYAKVVSDNAGIAETDYTTISLTGSNLEIKKYADKEAYMAGEVVHYTIEVGNKNPNIEAKQIDIADNIINDEMEVASIIPETLKLINGDGVEVTDFVRNMTVDPMSGNVVGFTMNTGLALISGQTIKVTYDVTLANNYVWESFIENSAVASSENGTPAETVSQITVNAGSHLMESDPIDNIGGLLDLPLIPGQAGTLTEEQMRELMAQMLAATGDNLGYIILGIGAIAAVVIVIKKMRKSRKS